MPPTAPTRGRRSPEESTELILDAAQRLLWEIPLSELSIGTLMAATPLGRSSFYVYFEDLDDLVARLLGRLEDALWDASSSWIEEDAGADGLARAIGGVVDVWVEHGPVLAAIVQASWQQQTVRSLWRDGLMQRFVAGVAEGIRRRSDDGAVHVEDPTETATALLLMNEDYLMDRLGRLPQADPERVRTTLTEIWTRALSA